MNLKICLKSLKEFT